MKYFMGHFSPDLRKFNLLNKILFILFFTSLNFSISFKKSPFLWLVSTTNTFAIFYTFTFYTSIFYVISDNA